MLSQIGQQFVVLVSRENAFEIPTTAKFRSSPLGS